MCGALVRGAAVTDAPICWVGMGRRIGGGSPTAQGSRGGQVPELPKLDSSAERLCPLYRGYKAVREEPV